MADAPFVATVEVQQRLGDPNCWPTHSQLAALARRAATSLGVSFARVVLANGVCGAAAMRRASSSRARSSTR
ncbi:hypothetical protein CVH10_23735 [Halomonas sp. ND22Bw]|nr:hypothetical protein CVH10_23735 [Halomonas sp. ND22Bw]